MSESGLKTIYRIDYRLVNPLLYHLLKYMMDPKIRRITNYGGSSSGKSYSIVQALLIITEYDNENTIVFRKVGASISKTVWEDFKVAAAQLGMADRLVFKESIRRIQFPSGAKIDFSGLDDPEKIKGISNYKRVFKDELSEFDKEDDDQIRKRLRGKEGQQIIDAFNPISEKHWIKTEYFDKEEWHDMPMDVELMGKRIPPVLTRLKALRINSPKTIANPQTGEPEVHPADTVITQTTYLNNYWVVGSPDGSFGFYDRQCVADFERDRINNPQFYNIYALGEWGVELTGCEYFSCFQRAKHCADVEYNDRLPIHMSVDNNVLPYITITFWQIDLTDGSHIRQIGEICAGPPDNSVQKAAKLAAEWLRRIQYTAEDRNVYLHGDASTKAANTIDEQKRSWLDLFIHYMDKNGKVVIDCVGNKNPSVPISGEFINAIYAGLFDDISITIGNQCTTSIDDYQSVQKDVNGGMEKKRVKNKTTGQTYEEHGHCSDTKRYVICDLLKSEYTAFSNRRKRNLYAKDGAISYYNPAAQCVYTDDIVYCMPNIGGRFVMAHGCKCGDKWHIVSARFMGATSTADMLAALSGCNGKRTILECPKSYYMMARELRDALEGDVRVTQESGDHHRRIAASADFIRDNVLFREDGDAEYSLFLENMLDYTSERNDNYEASAVMSGLAQAILKLGL